MSGLFRLIYWALLAYLIYAVIRFIRSLGRASRPRPSAKPRITTGVMVRDEECHMYLPREDAVREVKDGKEYFFCSQECRKKFLARKASGDSSSSSVS